MEGKRLIGIKVAVIKEYENVIDNSHPYEGLEYVLDTHLHDEIGEVLYSDILSYIEREVPRWKYRLDSYDRKVRSCLNNKYRHL